MACLFWASVAGIILAYAGYPLLLFIWGSMFRRPVAKAEVLPRVSIVIAAYNEEAFIGQTIENKIHLDYPRDRLEVLVVSDASTDGTDQIVERFKSEGVRLLVQASRQGKTAALNRAVPEAAGEIVAFSDANSIYAPDSLRKIVQNFADPSVGYVTGKMVYVDENGSVVGSGCSGYMRYENVLRSLETRVGSVVGVDGGVDAVRKALYRTMSPELLPDFVLPLSVVQNGFRVVFEEQALLKEHSLDSSSDEMRMRIRVILRSFHALWNMKSLFNPFCFGIFSLQLLIHKVVRYLVGPLQLLALVSNASLAGRGGIYGKVMAAQTVFYAMAVAGLLPGTRRMAICRYSYYLCLLNCASLVALVKFLRGENRVVWAPRKG